ncbi:PCRF domain-containing protein [Patescibacteria group bacterium]|nr:PCRF domain-containing protein [Patescibacteria group bacterium]
MNTDIQTIYLEVRGATGGDEAKIWASDLLRMYLRFAAKKGWKVTPIDDDVIKINGVGVFDMLKNESGVHRVQRIPATERHGRIHTSTATVVVLPEIKESDVQVSPNDLDIQFFHSSSQGGQNVQKVSTAVRITHKPTGIVVTSQRERFQEQNRRLAMDILRAKLFEKQEEEKMRTVAGYRSVIGRGMRAEKIRTYNFPQNRVTDHRIGKSWGNLEGIIDGELSKIVAATQANS